MPASHVDVRELHPKDRHPLIFDHLGRLQPGEKITLLNDHDPAPLRYQLDGMFPGQYGWEYVEQGPDRWAVDITSKVRTIDARPVIAAGGEPRETIMAAAALTEPGEVLVVLAPFEPVPLQGALGALGFDHVTDQVDESTWRVIFSRR